MKKFRDVQFHLVAIPMSPKPCPVCMNTLDGVLILHPTWRPPMPGDLTACPSCQTPLMFAKEGFELADMEHINRLSPRDREMFMMMIQSAAMSGGARPN